MKRIAGILAALSLGACGVGVDDPEGMAALLGDEQALQGSSFARPEYVSGVALREPAPSQESPEGQQREQHARDVNPLAEPTTGSVSAPQDPIPSMPTGKPASAHPGSTVPTGGSNPCPTR